MKRIKARRLRLNKNYDINVWGNKVYKGPFNTLSGLTQSIMTLAIASAVLGIATESLTKAGVLESQSGLNRKENQK